MLSRWRSHWMVKFMIANQKTSSKRQFKIFPDFCRLDIGPTKVSSCTFMVLSWKSTRMTSFELALHLRLLPKDTSVMSRLYLYGPRWMWTDQSRLWIWFYFLRRIKLDDLIPELAVLFDIRTKNASLMSIVSHNLWVMHYSGSETCFRGDMFQKVELKLSTVLILYWYCTGTVSMFKEVRDSLQQPYRFQILILDKGANNDNLLGFDLERSIKKFIFG